MSIKGGNVHGTIGMAFTLANLIGARPYTTVTLTCVAIFAHGFAFSVATTSVHAWTLFLGHTCPGTLVQDKSCNMQYNKLVWLWGKGSFTIILMNLRHLKYFL